MQAIGTGRTHRLIDGAVCLRPGVGQLHCRIGINQAETELIIELHTAQVPVAGPIGFPGQRVRVAGGECQDRLHIAVTQQRVGFEHQSRHARDHRRRSRGTAETGVVAGRIQAKTFLVPVGC